MSVGTIKSYWKAYSSFYGLLHAFLLLKYTRLVDYNTSNIDWDVFCISMYSNNLECTFTVITLKTETVTKCPYHCHVK